MDAPLPLYANPKFPRRAEGVSRRRRVSRGNWFPLEGAYPAAQRQRFSAENRRAFRKEAEPFAKHSSRPADGGPVPGFGRLRAGAGAGAPPPPPPPRGPRPPRGFGFAPAPTGPRPTTTNYRGLGRGRTGGGTKTKPRGAEGDCVFVLLFARVPSGQGRASSLIIALLKELLLLRLFLWFWVYLFLLNCYCGWASDLAFRCSL